MSSPSSRQPPFNLLTVLGPTASGKTRAGVALAQALDGEIISADSRQVFRGMDLGTGKDLTEYGDVPHHLIDVADPGTEFSVFAFCRAFSRAFGEIRRRGRLPILVGGTGLYLDAVLLGYRLVEVAEDPALRRELDALSEKQLRARLLHLRPGQHNRSDLEDRARLVRAIEIAEAEREGRGEVLQLPPLRPVIFGLRWERAELRRRIGQRLKERFTAGMLEEVADLHARGVSWEALEYYGLEYRFIAQHLQGRMNRNDMRQKLESAIGQFAKRQETWFRRMEKQGVKIHWVDGSREPAAAILETLQALYPDGRSGVSLPGEDT